MELGAAGRRPKKGLKQPPVQEVPLKQEFGVPLQPQEKPMCRLFDGFHNAVWGGGAGHQCLSDGFHRLVVRTVNPHARLPNNPVQ